MLFKQVVGSGVADELCVTCSVPTAEAGPCVAEESSRESLSSAAGIPNGLQGILQGAESLPTLCAFRPRPGLLG